MTMRNLLDCSAIVVAVSALALGACGEVPQDAAKPFAGKEETRSYAGELSERASTQNEYLITGDAKQEPALAAK